ncbi:MAG: hypothetical protein L0241_25625 [Planctomycetia bacterium]|nr:hypothetical protein [Planctomycetia bacterium]
MPITLTCACGKPLRVADQFAGRVVKCPVCGATQTAGQPVAQQAAVVPPAKEQAEFDDFEVVEETSAPATPKPPQSASKARVKAIAEEEPAPAPPPDNPTKPKKKKKKKKAEGEDDDWYERTRENEAWMKRVLRGSAFIIAGLVILIGVAIIYFFYWEDVKWVKDPRAKFGIIVFGILGLAAVGKGVIGLALGQFLGEDD